MLLKLAAPLSQKWVAPMWLQSHGLPLALHFSSQSSLFTVMPLSQAILSCIVHAAQCDAESFSHVWTPIQFSQRCITGTGSERIQSWEHYSGDLPKVTQIRKEGKRCKFEILSFLPLYSRAKSLGDQPYSEGLSVGTDKAMEVGPGSPFILSLQCWILVE